jgi:hypothetical protein
LTHQWIIIESLMNDFGGHAGSLLSPLPPVSTAAIAAGSVRVRIVTTFAFDDDFLVVFSPLTPLPPLVVIVVARIVTAVFDDDFLVDDHIDHLTHHLRRKKQMACHRDQRSLSRTLTCDLNLSPSK